MIRTTLILAAITALIGLIGGGFKWYTGFVSGYSAELQRFSDEATQAKEANNSYLAAIAWMDKDTKHKQKQIYLRDRAYFKVDAIRKDLEAKLLEVGNEELTTCNSLLIPDEYIDQLRKSLNLSGDDYEAADTVREGLPPPQPISAHLPGAFSWDDLRTVAEQLNLSGSQKQ
jgi:hypothetical protein